MVQRADGRPGVLDRHPVATATAAASTRSRARCSSRAAASRSRARCSTTPSSSSSGGRVVEALGTRGPCTVQAFRDREIGLGITDVNTRFGGAFPAPMYAALPGRTYPELIARMAAASPSSRTSATTAPASLHALLLAARARRGAAAHGARHRRPARPAGAALMAARVDYEERRAHLRAHRRTDPRIAARIHAALGDARTVLNVGAGAGSYEPATAGCWPSSRARRCAPSARRARRRSSPRGPRRCRSTTTRSTPRWPASPSTTGSRRRPGWPSCAASPAARSSCSPSTSTRSRLAEGALPRGAGDRAPALPRVDDVAAALGGRTRIERIPTPADCADGFFEAFWKRPEAMLDPGSAPPSRCGRS